MTILFYVRQTFKPLKGINFQLIMSTFERRELIQKKAIEAMQRKSQRAQSRYASKSGYRRKRWPVRRSGKGEGGNYASHNARTLFPMSKHVVFNYFQEIGMTAATSSYSAHVFRANSLYDPDLTATGHQPRYYDTLCGADGTSAPYQSYVVKGCKSELFIRSTSTDSWLVVSMTICRDDVTGPVTLNEARERTDTVTRNIPPLGTGSASGKLSMYRSMKNIFGVKDIEDYGAARAGYNANPTSVVRIYITVYNPDSGASESCDVGMKLTYYSKLFTRNDVQTS